MRKTKERNNEKTAKIGLNLTSNKGITLIALIITIIVMLILVAVTISMAINGGLFEKAGQAVGENQNAIDKEQQLANGKIQVEGLWYDSIDDYLAGNYSSVTNPYDEDGWVMAWTCTNGVWSDTIQEGETAEGDIVAKLYETGNKITPDDCIFDGQTVTFNEGNEYALVIEGQGEMGALMNSDSTVAYAWQFIPESGTSDTCIIPYVSKIIVCDGITNIQVKAFQNAISLSKITISTSVTSIGTAAFIRCKSLISITIPNSVINIENAAFGACTSLTSITIPNSVTSIGGNAFMGCTSLTSITIPNGVTNIGNHTFSGCTSLTSITIPNSVTSIKNQAFRSNTSLTSINYQGTQAEWNNISKGSSWNVNTSIAKIICTDGEISL